MSAGAGVAADYSGDCGRKPKAENPGRPAAYFAKVRKYKNKAKNPGRPAAYFAKVRYTTKL
jgi:hypothetical protein